MRTKIYIVKGNTGSFEDRIDWLVIAFKSKKKADDYARKCKIEAKKIYKKTKEYSFSSHAKNPLDAKMLMDYTGTFYTTEEIDLENE